MLLNRHKKLALTSYEVTFVDLRETKPRGEYLDIEILTDEDLSAARCLGINAVDYIRSHYEKGGFHVISVMKCKRWEAEIDLRDFAFTSYAQNTKQAAGSASAALDAEIDELVQNPDVIMHKGKSVQL